MSAETTPAEINAQPYSGSFLDCPDHRLLDPATGEYRQLTIAETRECLEAIAVGLPLAETYVPTSSNGPVLGRLKAALQAKEIEVEEHPEEAHLLWNAIKARDRLLNANIRFVRSIVTAIAIKAQIPRNDGRRSDLEQEGLLAFDGAIHRYRVEKSNSEDPKAGLLTFARPSISRRVRRMVRAYATGNIRVPDYSLDDRQRAEAVLSRRPSITAEELADELKVQLTQAERLLQPAIKVDSLAQPLNRAEDTDTLEDTVADTPVTRPEFQVVASQGPELILGALATVLSADEMRFVRSRLLNKATVQEAAQKFGVTQNRVKEIEASLLKKLSRIGPEVLGDYPRAS